MRVLRLLPLVLGVAVLASSLPAQGCFLQSTFNRNDNRNGFMFDISVANPAGLDITGFVLHLQPGLYDIQVYERAGSHVGFETSSAGWNLVGQLSNLISSGNDQATELPVSMSIPVASGATHAFYIVATNSNGMWGILGTGVGNAWNSNADMTIFEGQGGAVFSATTNSVWNGIIRYTVTGTADQFQTNSFGSHMDIDGAITYGCSVGISNKTVNSNPCSPTQIPATGNLKVSTLNAGQSWELVSSPDPVQPVPGLGIGLPGGKVNLNFANFFAWSFVNGGTNVGLLPFPSGFPGALGASFTINYAFTTAPTDISAQAVITDPNSPAGYTLSQANELHITQGTGATSVTGPIGDDTRVTVDFGNPALCWAQNGFPLYGISYTQMHVESNGRTLFGPPPASLFFTLGQPSDLLSGAASVGMWCDLNPSPQTGSGTITIQFVAPEIIVSYNAVQYFGETGTSNTYQVKFDTATGFVTLDGLQGIDIDPELGQVDDAWLGISPGATFGIPGTDPGVVGTGGGFTINPVLSPSTGQVADMIYDYYTGLGGVPGQPATIPNGVNTITFIPDAANCSPMQGGGTFCNYNWFAQ